MTSRPRVLILITLAPVLVACRGEEKDASSAQRTRQHTPPPDTRLPPTPPPAPTPAQRAATESAAIESKPIDPVSLPPALAKIYQATTGISSRKGGFAAFHKAVVAKHGKPTMTVEMYGKPA